MQQDPVLKDRARASRRNSTSAERALWFALRAHRLSGVKVSRQVPVGPYILDFAARSAKLAIELDGDSHAAQVEYDVRRTAFLTAQGYRVIRFSNAEVMGNLEGVLHAIGLALAAAPLPTLSPGGERALTTPGLLPEGLRDRLPPQAEAASRLLHRVIVAIGRNGYARVAPPIAEYEDELVGRLKRTRARDLFRVVDPVSQRTLAFRPDITAQVGRIAATRMAHRARPLRLAYGGPVLKLRASQLRPGRELVQAGAELIGSDSVAAASEVLRVAIEALEAAGVTGVTVDLTLPDLVDTLAAGALPLPTDRIEAVQGVLDAKDAGGLAALGAAGYLPLIEAAGPLDSALAQLRALPLADALASRLDGIAAIAAGLGGRVALTLDPTERHGFEYQSWLGFSLFAEGLAGEVGRGGTYAIVHADGREEPAVGFSLYLDPLVDAGLGQEPRRHVFVPFDADSAAAAALRHQGWTTLAALAPGDVPPAGCTHILDGTAPSPLKD